ncbi:MAG TPA: uroporphyrinogen-III C-methyltransferase [Candidatus Baltobacteraceae bacterium]|nr:uroporphyrinogen-III C-methyltransferase [Candidatus Baltobacteraceae bacterium]
MSSGRVSLVGAGPGDPGLLCVRAAEVLAQADVLLYDALASDPIVALAPTRCERIFVGKRGGNHAMPQSEIEALAIQHARAGKHVVRLKGGDPFVFGRGGEEAQALYAAGIPFQIVPGISSAIAAPAYAGIPVTHRDFNTAFTVVTGHEDPSKNGSTLDWSKLADPNRTLVFLMATGNLESIAEKLVVNGLAATTPVAVIENGTRPTQRTVVSALDAVAQDVARAGIGAPAIVVVGDVVTLRGQLQWFDRAPLFGKRVLVTRPARQAESFVRALYARGVEPILASTILIVPPDDPRPAHRAIDDLAGYGWVVFTSQNGVDAFFDRLAALDTDARYFGKTKIAAIGSKTAQRLRDRGVRADLVPAAFVSEEIGRALLEKTGEGERILIYRAQEARDALPTMLEDADRNVTVVAAYKTIFEIDPAFATKVASADVLTFTSASTVRGFVELLGGEDAARNAARGKLVACIGPITTDAADALGLHVDVVADVYTTDGLLDALEARLALLH